MTKHEKLIEKFERFIQEYDRDIGFISYDEEVLYAALELLKEVEPIRQGTWNTKWFDHKERIVCSECECMADRMTDYCPNCGARMEVNNE